MPLAVLFVAARVFSRLRLEAGLWLDDYLMIGALLTYLADGSTGLSIVKEGFGQHTWYLTEEQFTRALEVSLAESRKFRTLILIPYLSSKLLYANILLSVNQFFFISELLYFVAMTLTKLSLLFFFRRVFPGKAMRLGTLYFSIFVVLSNVSVFFAVLFQCLPITANWTNWKFGTSPPVKCVNTYAIVQVGAALGIFHDFVIMIMPLPTLWGLNLAWAKKINLFAMFMVGFVVIICSALRVPSLIRPKSSADISCKFDPSFLSLSYPFPHHSISFYPISRIRLQN
jgi:hypothetical protein